MSKMTTEMLYASKKECCGCEMCAQTCPKGIINIVKDAEGFLYPEILDGKECVECGTCQKVCPVKHASDIHSFFIGSYAGWDINPFQVITSSSGGAANALSRAFVGNGGVVYGVTYSNGCKSIEYKRVQKEEDLFCLKGSKYSQATKSGLIKQIKADLRNGEKVLFLGVPCDCAGIKRVFGMNDNLFIISLVCHGPTSPLVHEQFCELLELRYDKPIEQFSMRYKKDGKWKPYYIQATFLDGTKHLEKFETSSYNTAFQFFKRPSCNACVFKADKFVADLLVGDFHAAKPGTDTYNENGVSSILVLTERGQEMLNGISEDFFFKEVDEAISTHQVAIKRAVKARVNRSRFSFVFQKNGLEAAARIPSVAVLEMVDHIKLKIKKLGVKVKKIIR